MGAQVAAEIQESLQVCISVEQHRGVTGGPQKTTAPDGSQQSQHVHTFETRESKMLSSFSITLYTVLHCGKAALQRIDFLHKNNRNREKRK